MKGIVKKQKEMARRPVRRLTLVQIGRGDVRVALGGSREDENGYMYVVLKLEVRILLTD